MIKRVGKRGDTLIEVMLAVGIFSMVAVAVVAVMSGGTSSAQTALETTLAREEIDAQAEALRFIQASYIADKNDGDSSKYSKLWEAITGKAYNYDVNTKSWSEITDELSQYSPTSCSELYEGNNSEVRNHGFILNTQMLGTFDEERLGEVIATGDILQPASTYPHLIFGNDFSNSDQENLVSDSSFAELKRAEGIYIIAVKDPKSTTIAGSESGKESAYFDFYIRTCWYGTGDQNPSTISTVMRLYDPDAIKEIKVQTETDESPSPADYSYLSDKKYKIDGEGQFTTIDGRDYEKTDSGTAVLGFVCHTWPTDSKQYPGESYVGPVLVSTSSAAVGYKTVVQEEPWTSGDTFVYNGRNYYYSSWGSWMFVDSCDNARSKINQSKIEDFQLYIFNQPKTGPDAIKEAAQQLIKDATSD